MAAAVDFDGGRDAIPILLLMAGWRWGSGGDEVGQAHEEHETIHGNTETKAFGDQPGPTWGRAVGYSNHNFERKTYHTKHGSKTGRFTQLNY